MSVAALLRRALSSELGAEWPQGVAVVRTLSEPLEGRVAFVEDGWIYWAASDGHVHASRPDALRRIA